MEKDYSRSAFKWHLYPLLSFPVLLLLGGIIFISEHIAVLNRLTDFIFLIYLLIIILLPVLFALCAIPSVIFSIKAMRNQESKQKLIGNIMIAGIYLAAGIYFAYHFTYQILTSMI